MNKIWNLNYSFILTLLILFSCSIMKPREDTSPVRVENILTPCKKLGKFNLASSNNSLNKDFQKFLSNYERLSFIEASVLWQLIQMNVRPDLASINSDLYILIKNNKDIKYFHFTPTSEKSYSYLQGATKLLAQYNSKRTLTELAKILQRNYKGSITINTSLSAELKKYKTTFHEMAPFRKAFLRGEQILGTQESLPKLPFNQIIKRYKKEAVNFKLSTKLFPYNKQISCNRKNFNTIATRNIVYHPFAIYDNRGNAMIAVATQQYESPLSWKNTMLFQRGKTKNNAFLCYAKGKRKDALIIAINNRSTSQIMNQYLQGLQTLAPTTLAKKIERSRTVKLLNPSRIMYEYDRGTEQKYQKILSIGVPVYGKMSLGLIWTYYHDNKKTMLLLDSRSSTYQSCNQR